MLPPTPPFPPAAHATDYHDKRDTDSGEPTAVASGLKTNPYIDADCAGQNLPLCRHRQLPDGEETAAS